MNCAEVIHILEQQAAERYACDWDNVGLLAGSRNKEIKKIYIALDATDEVVQEAADAGADMLLTHHPLIFGGLRRVTEDDFIGRRLMKIIRADMAYYAMHTNFDVMGMADLAAGMLGLKETEPLEVTCEKDGVPQGIGRIGMLEGTMPLSECCRRVKEAFGISRVKVFGRLSGKVKRAAICPGSGKDNLEDAILKGADVYITGDIGHHAGIDAKARGMAVIDAGHYGIERIFVPYMKGYLEEQIEGITVVTRAHEEPFAIV